MKGWHLYPLWGLELEPNGFGLESPVFGDATLVTRNFVEKQAPSEPSVAGMFSGGGLRTLLESQGATRAGSAPLDRLIDIPPGAFIAVRRRDSAAAQRYAESLCALLTGTSVLTAGSAKGFAMSPLALQWSAIPAWVRQNTNGELQIDYKVIASSFVHLTPISVSHKQLIDSWEKNVPIGASWRIHRDAPLAKALVGDWGSLGPLRRRIRDAAITLTKAMGSPDPALSTLFAAVALEQLLKDGASNFAEVEEMAKSIFSGSRGPDELSRLIGNRHKVAHEARGPENSEDHVREIGATWALFHLAAIAADSGLDTAEFLDHLRGRVEARRVAARLRAVGRPELADEVDRAATHLVPRKRENKKPA